MFRVQKYLKTRIYIFFTLSFLSIHHTIQTNCLNRPLVLNSWTSTRFNDQSTCYFASKFGNRQYGTWLDALVECSSINEKSSTLFHSQNEEEIKFVSQQLGKDDFCWIGHNESSDLWELQTISKASVKDFKTYLENETCQAISHTGISKIPCLQVKLHCYVCSIVSPRKLNSVYESGARFSEAIEDEVYQWVLTLDRDNTGIFPPPNNIKNIYELLQTVNTFPTVADNYIENPDSDNTSNIFDLMTSNDEQQTDHESSTTTKHANKDNISDGESSSAPKIEKSEIKDLNISQENLQNLNLSLNHDHVKDVHNDSIIDINMNTNQYPNRYSHRTDNNALDLNINEGTSDALYLPGHSSSEEHEQNSTKELSTLYLLTNVSETNNSEEEPHIINASSSRSPNVDSTSMANASLEQNSMVSGYIDKDDVDNTLKDNIVRDILRSTNNEGNDEEEMKAINGDLNQQEKNYSISTSVAKREGQLVSNALTASTLKSYLLELLQLLDDETSAEIIKENKTMRDDRSKKNISIPVQSTVQSETFEKYNSSSNIEKNNKNGLLLTQLSEMETNYESPTDKYILNTVNQTSETLSLSEKMNTHQTGGLAALVNLKEDRLSQIYAENSTDDDITEVLKVDDVIRRKKFLVSTLVLLIILLILLITSIVFYSRYAGKNYTKNQCSKKKSSKRIVYFRRQVDKLVQGWYSRKMHNTLLGENSIHCSPDNHFRQFKMSNVQKLTTQRHSLVTFYPKNISTERVSCLTTDTVMMDRNKTKEFDDKKLHITTQVFNESSYDKMLHSYDESHFNDNQKVSFIKESLCDLPLQMENKKVEASQTHRLNNTSDGSLQISTNDNFIEETGTPKLINTNSASVGEISRNAVKKLPNVSITRKVSSTIPNLFGINNQQQSSSANSNCKSFVSQLYEKAERSFPYESLYSNKQLQNYLLSPYIASNADTVTPFEIPSTGVSENTPSITSKRTSQHVAQVQLDPTIFLTPNKQFQCNLSKVSFQCAQKTDAYIHESKDDTAVTLNDIKDNDSKLSWSNIIKLNESSEKMNGLSEESDDSFFSPYQSLFFKSAVAAQEQIWRQKASPILNKGDYIAQLHPPELSKTIVQYPMFLDFEDDHKPLDNLVNL